VIALIITAGTGGFLLAQTEREEQRREPIPVEIRENIRVVYEIKTDEWKEGVGAGLHYVKKLIDAYRAMGIPNDEIHVSAVFHGDAGYWMLKDAAYAVETESGGPNPNREIIDELVNRDVSLELCAQTMRSHGWGENDVLPGVKIVIGAYPRVIDLQLAGYAYIRF